MRFKDKTLRDSRIRADRPVVSRLTRERTSHRLRERHNTMMRNASEWLSPVGHGEDSHWTHSLQPCSPAVRAFVIEFRPARGVLAAALLGLLGLAAPAMAAPREVKASVVWVRDERVYLTSPDSSALAQGVRLTFLYRGQPLASGEVARVYDRDLALATLTSGSLEKVKKLDRLRVLAQPPPLPDVPMLRIGYPARGRCSLPSTSGQMTVMPPILGEKFRVEASGENSYRLVRRGMWMGGFLWPDTLLIRLFEEAADEEIALERGELDVAVFWPGELSAHARENPRWQGSGSGLWAWGVIAARWDGPDASGVPQTARADSLDLASFNREMFRGDLMPWPGEAARALPTNTLPPFVRSKWWPRPARFALDPSFSGQRALERFLNRDLASSTGEDARTVRLVYLDAPVGVTDSLARDGVQVSFLFGLRCPLVCAEPLRPYIEALGGDALVNMIWFEPPRRRP